MLLSDSMLHLYFGRLSQNIRVHSIIIIQATDTMSTTTADNLTFSRTAFAGKVAFVTGGGTGICKDITEALLLHGCAGVAIVSRRLAVLEQTAREQTEKAKAAGSPGVCIALAADVRIPEQVRLTLRTFPIL